MPPPIKVAIRKDGTPKIIDGNHRFWSAYLDGAEWIEADDVTVPVDEE